MDAPHTRLECARTAGMFVYRTDFTVPTTVTVRRNLESGRLTADHISYAPVIYQLSRSKHELSLSTRLNLIDNKFADSDTLF